MSLIKMWDIEEQHRTFVKAWDALRAEFHADVVECYVKAGCYELAEGSQEAVTPVSCEDRRPDRQESGAV